MRALVLFVLSAGGLTILPPAEDPRAEDALPPAASPAEARPAIEAELLEAVRVYRTYGHVDDEVRWAPSLCRPPQPSIGRVSESDDERTHGRKLYYVLARDRTAYLDVANRPAPVGQVIVKESWHAEEIGEDVEVESRPADPRPLDAGADVPVAPGIRFGCYLPLATKDGKRFTTGEKGPLFVMMKKDPSTPDTDEGWVYATLTADGKSVTASGRVASCMRCHSTAPHDRQFGLKEVSYTWSGRR